MLKNHQSRKRSRGTQKVEEEEKRHPGNDYVGRRSNDEVNEATAAEEGATEQHAYSVIIW